MIDVRFTLLDKNTGSKSKEKEKEKEKEEEEEKEKEKEKRLFQVLCKLRKLI